MDFPTVHSHIPTRMHLLKTQLLSLFCSNPIMDSISLRVKAKVISMAGHIIPHTSLYPTALPLFSLVNLFWFTLTDPAHSPPSYHSIIPGTLLPQGLCSSWFCMPGKFLFQLPTWLTPSSSLGCHLNCIHSMRFPPTTLFYTGICPTSQFPTPDISSFP